MDSVMCRIWVGNLSQNISEDILYELFLQAGPVLDVTIPKDGYGKQKSFAFVTFKHPCSVSYSIQLFDGTLLYNKELIINQTKESVAQQHRMNALNSLKGFSGNFNMAGRDDLSTFNSGSYPSSMANECVNSNDFKYTPPPDIPKIPDFVNSIPNMLFANLPDLNKLHEMGQNLLHLENPYASMIGINNSEHGYPSQMLDPVMSNKRDDYSARHSRERRQSPNYERQVRYDRPHPYDDNRRRDDRRHSNHRREDRRHGHSRHSYHQSSSSHRRERR